MLTADPEQAVARVKQNSSGRPRIGIIGAGQLARMTALAAVPLGLEIVILGAEKSNPGGIFSNFVVGDWHDLGALKTLAERCDVITLENEFVDADHLADLESAGFSVRPSSHTIRLIQDKFRQKTELAAAGIAVPKFLAVEKESDLPRAAEELGFPLVLKTRRNGYDGKGNATVRGPADFRPAWEKLGAPRNKLYAEQFCPFTSELAVMITRGLKGELATYPVAESIQRDHICHEVRVPAAVYREIQNRAVALAKAAVEALDGVGTFGVEMFLREDGQVILNEVAPRVHNSGHYTIEGSACSQFENHLRAILGWPLGSTEMVAPAAVMINLLGTCKASGHPSGLDLALSHGAHVHLYGKTTSAAGRKMGHVTARGATLEEALSKARQTAAEIKFENPL